jgi:hypothetical protein
MKRIKIAVLFFCVMPSVVLEAQVGMVSAPVLEALMSNAQIENTIKYIQMIEQQIENAKNTYNQFQNALRMEKMAMDNLKSIGNIKNFNDAKNWYNRQLYLEQQAESKYTNMGIKIGNTNYKMQDITKIPGAFREQFIDYDFSSAMSEAERKAMWTKLGLSPSNYVYLKTWQAREDKIVKQMLTERERQNEENTKDAEKYNAMLERYNSDADMPEDGRLTAKDLALDGNALLIDTNKKLSTISDLLAAQNELNMTRMMQEKTPASTRPLSETYDEAVFNSLPGTKVEITSE